MGDGRQENLRKIDTVDYADATDVDGTVVIGMGAGWCGPWRAFLPVFSEVASMLADDSVTFMTCDLGTDVTIALLENVTRIPTVLVYRDGRRVGRHVGMMSARELVCMVSGDTDGGGSDAGPDGTGEGSV